MSFRRLAQLLSRFTRVALDSAPLIYHVEDVRPYADLMELILADVASRGGTLLISTVALAEVMAGPWRHQEGARARLLEESLGGIPGALFVDVTREAARLGGEFHGRLRLDIPDALVLSSAIIQRADAFVTNDKALDRRELPLKILVLDDYA